MMDSETIKRGAEILDSLVPGGAERLNKSLGSSAPDMANYVQGFIFGNLYSRPGLDLKTKQILTITILATLGNAKPQLAYHIGAALNIGVSEQEILDIMVHISGYASFPASLNGIATAKEVFARRAEVKSS